MSKAPVKNLLYLSSSQTLPTYLQGVKGVRWNMFQDLTSLKDYLKRQKQGEVILVVKSTFMGLKAVEVFLSWNTQVKLFIVFIAQTIEKAAYQLAVSDPRILFLYESEGSHLAGVVTRCIHGNHVKSRKHERVQVKSQVMIKKSILAERSPVGDLVQFLRDGQMRDFSRGGALVALKEGGVRVKDFVSLMYQDRHGKWVSVESQVRWVVSTTQGEQIIGVQFLAVSA